MADITYYWNGDRQERAESAAKHTERMSKECAAEIKNSIDSSEIYTPHYYFHEQPRSGVAPFIKLDAIDSAAAIFKYAKGKTAVLNFASYKFPGGGFLAGSRAQEECLCQESFLYNVLSSFDAYYDWNKQHLHGSMYTNRAIYSPDVRFFKEGKSKLCDVITCAAPNWQYSRHATKEDNSIILESRIKFILDIAAEQKVETLILGAFGCGVFGQDAEEVARLFMRHINSRFKNVIFAVPKSVHVANYEQFAYVIGE